MPAPFSAGEIERFETAVISRPLSPAERAAVNAFHATQGLDLTRAFFAAGLPTAAEAAALAAPRRTVTSSRFVTGGPLALPIGTPGLTRPPSTFFNVPTPPLLPTGRNVQLSQRFLAAIIPGLRTALPFLPVAQLDQPVPFRAVAGGIRVPFLSTGSIGFGESIGQGLGGLIAGIPSALGQIFGPSPQITLPGGFPGVSQASLLTPGQTAFFPGFGQTAAAAQSLFGGGNGRDMSSPFGTATPTQRAQIHVVPNPSSGRPTWFGPLGRPLLWSRDLSSAKKVNRLARRARRRGGR